MAEIKLFDRWSTEGIKVDDPGLKNYINLKPVLVVKTGARYAGNRFHKSKINIVERLTNKLMGAGHKSKKHFKSSGHTTGKSNTVYNMVEKTLEIIENKLRKTQLKYLLKQLKMLLLEKKFLLLNMVVHVIQKQLKLLLKGELILF